MEVSWSLVALLVLAIFALSRLLSVGRRPADYPPGPPTLPILGNLHLLDPDKTHLQFQKWAAEYGPVFSLMLGTKCMVVLSTPEAINDLLNKRGNIYSSRPESHIVSTATNGLNLVMMEYNESWKQGHRLLHKSLNASASKTYVPYQDLENKQMLQGLIDEPELFNEHIRRYTNSLTTQLVFGFRTIDLYDPKLLQLYTEFERWIQLTKNSLMVLADYYPVLRTLPDMLLPLRRTAKELYKSEHDLFLGHWNDTKARQQENKAQPCIALDLMRSQKTERLSDDQASHLCGILLEAGSDTSAVELRSFVKAMVLSPEPQRKAQEELDQVCGDRMPEIGDAEALPYIRACVKEVCRWGPAVLMGIPHSLVRDDSYMGYKIPAGAMVLMNVWSVHMDAKRHHNPRKYDPSRYLNNCDKSARRSALSPNPEDRDHYLFGAGRRMCPGMDLADNSLFLALARILWAFSISPALDDRGKEILPDADDIIAGLPAHPAPFKAVIRPRSEKRAQEVGRQWSQAQAEFLDDDSQWKQDPIQRQGSC